MTLHRLEIEHKVIDSDGTVVITRGNQFGDCHYIQALTLKHHRPYLHIDLKELSNTEAALKIAGDICIYTNHNLTIEELDIA